MAEQLFKADKRENKFNEPYGNKIVADINDVNPQNYQIKRNKLSIKINTIF